MVRVLSVALPKSGSWLNCVPCKALGLHLSNKEFLVSAKYRLGLPIYGSDGTCPSCQSPSDRYGDHAIICAYDGERISRHNMLRDALFKAASQAGVQPAKEEAALIPGSDARPADIFLPRFENGTDCALNVIVVSPVQQALLTRAGVEPGGNRLIPLLPYETFGVASSSTISTISRIGKSLAAHSEHQESKVVSHLFQRLGVLLAKGNSALLLSSPPHISPDLDGD